MNVDDNLVQYVLGYQTSDPANAMLLFGLTAIPAGALVTTSVAADGSGTIDDWTIVLVKK
ncbi:MULTISPECIES: hypothetical protein [unclassified Bradyrhizobium]|uniref:hypothetical protein n=1 Tax=unclassified Bradyrhizobium TaxID=2631580 RepID=UPI002FF28EF6